MSAVDKLVVWIPPVLIFFGGWRVLELVKATYGAGTANLVDSTIFVVAGPTVLVRKGRAS